MLLKIARFAGCGLAGVALANVAMAQGNEGVNVQTAAESMKVGGEFKAEMVRDDNGLRKVTGQPEPEATTRFGVNTARIKLRGNLNKDTEYAFRFNLLGAMDPNTGHSASPLDYGYGTHWFTKMVGFSFGRMKVLQGGFDHIDGGYRNHARGVHLGTYSASRYGGTSHLAFNEYEDMAAVHLNAAGNKITLQLLNDYAEAAIDADGLASDRYNRVQQPTWVLGWRGAFGPIEPMINFGSYDNNKSSWYDVGVKTNMAGLTAALDYWTRNDVLRGTNAAGNATEVKDTYTALTVQVGYTIANTAMPWAYFSTYERKEATGTGLATRGGDVRTTETKINAPGAFDDNGQVWGVGADLLMMGRGWAPYVALVGTSGKYANTTGGEESRSGMQIKLGVLGEI